MLMHYQNQIKNPFNKKGVMMNKNINFSINTYE